jgi:hypothetical protein
VAFNPLIRGLIINGACPAGRFLKTALALRVLLSSKRPPPSAYPHLDRGVSLYICRPILHRYNQEVAVYKLRWLSEPPDPTLMDL